MPDLKDYLPDDVTYVKGHVRRKRGTVGRKEHSTWGWVFWWWIAINAGIFLILADYKSLVWIAGNLILAVIILIFVFIAPIVGFAIYKRNKQKSVEKEGDKYGRSE